MISPKKNLDDADDDEGDGRQALQGRGNNEVQTEGVPKDAGIVMDFHEDFMGSWGILGSRTWGSWIIQASDPLWTNNKGAKVQELKRICPEKPAKKKIWRTKTKQHLNKHGEHPQQ